MFSKPKPLLEVGPVWTRIIKKTDELYAALDAAEETLGDSIGIYNKSFTSFLSGFVPYVVRKTDAGYFNVDKPVVDIGNPTLNYIDRPYQKDAVETALKNKRGILQLPTGAGKTRIAVAIMHTVRGRWLYLAPKGNLVDSTAEQFERLTNEPVGILRGTTNTCKDKRVICATYDSAYSNEEFYAILQSVDGVIADEAHACPAITRFCVLLATGNANYRIGLSATPLIREDGRDVLTVGLLGPVVYSIGVKDLAINKYLVLPKIRWVDCKLDRYKGINDYGYVYDECIVRHADRNIAVCKAVENSMKPVITFVTKHEHQKLLYHMIKYRLPGSVMVNETTSIEDRNQIVDMLKRRAIQHVISTQVFSEGMDVPNLRTVINATGQASWIQTIQELGRGCRPYPGKDSFEIVDFNDTGQEWFEDHTAHRYSAYKFAGFDVDAPSWLAKRVYKKELKRVRAFEEFTK